MLNFDVNVSLLWRDLPLVERFARARQAGFGAVEFYWPRGENLEDVVRTVQESDLRVVLHNMDAGDMAKGERGYANDPARTAEWRRMFEVAVDFARRIACPRVNCLAGNDLHSIPREAQLEVVLENFRWALSLAQQHGVTMMVEPLNTFDSPGYLWPRSADGIAFLERAGSSWVRLQYDVYHMQRMEGEVAAAIRRHVQHIGHVQIADEPGRHEPGTGRINWRVVFGAIEESGYNGYVGLEYLPASTPEESFRWLPADKRGQGMAQELNL